MKLKHHVLIGTLYCAKGNYEFGISRVIKSLEPYNKKLGTDTWFYAKRCFLSLIENLAKHMISVRDSVIQVTYIEKQRKCIKSRFYVCVCVLYIIFVNHHFRSVFNFWSIVRFTGGTSKPWLSSHWKKYNCTEEKIQLLTKPDFWKHYYYNLKWNKCFNQNVVK